MSEEWDSLDEMAHKAGMKLEPFETAEVDIGAGHTIQVHWDSDKRELVVILHGRRAGRIAAIPRSGNAFSIVRAVEVQPSPAAREGGEEDERG